MSQESISFQDALERAKNYLANSKGRTIIGIVGKPGAGKSQLSSFLMDNLPKDEASLLPMDGYHLSNKVLADLGRADRKGAPDTFDSSGFSALLDRISKASNEEIYYPIFHREFEESYAAEGVISPKTKLIITEGNYLLLDQGGWATIRSHLTESWYVGVNDELRLERLVDRHHQFGKEREVAHEWAHGTDERNAEVVEGTKKLADFIVLNS
jgi:pantothenate kinase